MELLKLFSPREKNTAKIAKERLKIVVTERRRSDIEPQYLLQLRKDILETIYKNTQINPEIVSLQLKKKEGISILELNITFTETENV